MLAAQGLAKILVLLLGVAATVVHSATAGEMSSSNARSANFTAVVELSLNATVFEQRVQDALMLQSNTTVVVLTETFGLFNMSSSEFTPSPDCTQTGISNETTPPQLQCTRNFTFVFEGPDAENASVAFGQLNVTSAQAIGLYSVTIPLTVVPSSSTPTSVPTSVPTTSTPIVSTAPQANQSDDSGNNMTLVIVIPCAVGVVVLIAIMCYCAGRVARNMNHHAPLDEGSVPRDNNNTNREMATMLPTATTAAIYTYQQLPPFGVQGQMGSKQPQHPGLMASPTLTFSDRFGSSVVTQSGAQTPKLMPTTTTPIPRGPPPVNLHHSDPFANSGGRPPQHLPSPAVVAGQPDSAPPALYNLETSAVSMYSSSTPPPSSRGVVFSPSQLRHHQRMLRFSDAVGAPPHHS
jgi:hypothetical protein